MPELYHILKLISAGELSDARQELAAVLKRDPQHLEAWSLMALAVTAPAQKADCYRRVLALDPSNENARFQLAALEKALNAPAGANSPAAVITPSATVAEPLPPPAPVTASIDRMIADAPVPPSARSAAQADESLRLTPAGVVAVLTDTIDINSRPVQATPSDGVESSQIELTRESCSQQLGYLGIGFIILAMVGMCFSVGMTATNGSSYDGVPDTPAGAICYGVSALVIFPLFLYLAHKGWDTPPEMSPILKFAWLFMVALPTPWGWYWMGRGASRLVESWAGRYKQGSRTATQKRSPSSTPK